MTKSVKLRLSTENMEEEEEVLEVGSHLVFAPPHPLFYASYPILHPFKSPFGFVPNFCGSKLHHSLSGLGF